MMRELLSALSAIFAFISFCPPPALLTLVGQRVEQKKKKKAVGARRTNIYYLWHEPLNNLTRRAVDEKMGEVSWWHLAHVSVNRKLN